MEVPAPAPDVPEWSIDAEWNSYIEALDSLKRQRIEALCQTAYDRYMDL